jgi:hypothetical protein
MNPVNRESIHGQPFGGGGGTPITKKELLDKYEAAGAPSGKTPDDLTLQNWARDQGYVVQFEGSTSTSGVGGDGGDIADVDARGT